MWHTDLGDEQREAAGADEEHGVLLAGPGTGKTFVIVRRVQFLIEELDVPPEQITALTFTRAAAAEMRERLAERLGDAGAQVRVSTLHSYALRELLRRTPSELLSPLRVVDDWEEANVVVQEIAKRLGRTPTDVGDLFDQMEADWSTLRADDTGWEDEHPDPAFIGGWRDHRQVYGYTLRSELIYGLLQELRSDPEMAPTQTRVLLVDEYQDLNKCDLEVIDLLAARAGASLFVAGDDDQSIYGNLRKAHPVGIRSFADEHDAEELVLNECRRCGQNIIDLATHVIEQDGDRAPKELRSVTDDHGTVRLVRPRDQNEEALLAARLARAHVDNGLAENKILILMKSDKYGATSRPIIKALGDVGLEAYNPRAPLENPDDIERLLQWLTLSESLDIGTGPDDLAVRALLDLEHNELGFTRLYAVTQTALEHGLRYVEALDYLQDNPSEYGSTALARVLDDYERIRRTAEDFAHGDDESLEAWVGRTSELAGLSEEAKEELAGLMAPTISELTDVDKQEGPLDYAQLLRAAVTKVGTTLPTAQEGKVTLTTMHGAKGLTADVVVALQVEDEELPGRAETAPEVAESRRLLYVSLTRATTYLYMSACRRRTGAARYRGSADGPGRSLSRFLRDVGLVAITPTQALDELV